MKQRQRCHCFSSPDYHLDSCTFSKPLKEEDSSTVDSNRVREISKDYREEDSKENLAT